MDRHGPVNRLPRISPNEIEHISSKKNKIREVSPKRKHLKRSASPFVEKSRREIVSPVAKKRDKSDKVSNKVQICFKKNYQFLLSGSRSC
jgi:hypothetical protein